MPTNLSDVSLLSRVTLERFVGIFFFQKIFPTFEPNIFLDLCAMPTNLSAVFLLSSVTSQICRHFFFGTIFRLSNRIFSRKSRS